MRTESFRRGLISIPLIFALVLSMAFIAPPVLAPAVISEPCGTTENVDPGQEFILRFRLEWDRPGAEELGYFMLAVTWDSPGKSGTPSENFTFLSAEAYFDLDGDNLPDDPGSDITVDYLELSVGVVAGNARYNVVVGHTIGDERDGEFNVDLKFSAAGIGGVPHIPGVHTMSIVGTIDVFEGEVTYSYSPPVPTITVRVPGPGVAVSISPSENSGPPGATLSYSVTVTNTGTFDDTYELTISDNKNWGPTLDNYLFKNVQPRENRTATLSVTVPENAVPCTEDNITVTAISQENTEVEDNASCIAHAEEVRHGVEVSISPENQSGPPKGKLEYIVTVKNTGTVEDNYSLTVGDNENWDPTLSENLLENVGPSEDRVITLNVMIPENAVTGTEDNITVKVTGTGVENSASCIARAFSIRGVEIAVSPEYQVDPPGTTLTYTITVTNTGNENDTYALTVGDSAGWISEELVFYSTSSDGSIENTGPNYSYTRNATTGTIRNNVETVNIGQVRDVDFTIWRTFLFFDTSRIPDGAAITSATLSLYGYADWSDENFEVLVQNGQPTYPHDPLEAGDYYRMHYGDNGGSLNTSNFKTDNYNDITLNEDGRSWIGKTGTTKFCLRSSRDNENIEPSGLYEFIEVFTSEADEDYQPKLTVTLSRTISRLTIPPGENRTTTFVVTIPENTAPGTRDNITFTATSRADSAVSDYVNSVALSGKVALEVSISPSRQSGINYYDIISKKYDLKYLVWVTNKGNLPDNYTLTYNRTLGWDLSLPGFLIPAGEKENVILYVKVPFDAKPGTEENITVVVTSQTDNTVSDNAICTARADIVDMEVTVSPSYQKGSPGEDFVYRVTVKNKGDGVQPMGYLLTVGDNENWGPTIDNQLTLASGESATTKVKVGIPDDATHNTRDNLTVLVEAIYLFKYRLEVYRESSAIAHAETLKLFISPNVDSARPGENLTFTVLVMNVGIENDNYDLTVSDDAGWGGNITLSESSLKDVTPGESRQATLTITIPEDAELGTEDNVMVTVIPKAGPAARESENCVAIAAPLRGVRVSISPKSRIGPGGATITYVVIVKNVGTENDSYDLDVDDDADPSWVDNITLLENLLVVPGLEHRGTILEVTIPREAAAGTVNNIHVKVTSRENVENVENAVVSASASCAAQIEIPAWIKRAIVRGDATGYNLDEGAEWDVPPEVLYSPGDYPPLMVAKRVENGAVVAAGLVSTCRGTRWKPDEPTGKLDVLLDMAFRWMKPDNTAPIKVLWYGECEVGVRLDNENYYVENGVFNDANVGKCEELIKALTAKGYTMEDTMDGKVTRITSSLLENYDILVIPELQLGDWGAKGGDTSLLPDNDVQAIENFVKGGGGLLIMEGTDHFGWNNCKVQNKILTGLGIDDIYFQSDQVNQNDAYWFDAEVTDVDFGENYRKATGLTQVCVYSTCSLVVKPEKKKLDVFIEFIPPSYLEGLPGETLTYTLTISNTGKLGDTYVLDAVDNSGFVSSVSPSTMTLAAGASDNATLSVTIPEGMPRGMESRITIAVTSLGDPTLVDVAYGEAWTGALDVSASIDPTSKSGLPGENLKFYVFITNTGDFEDNYTLGVSDNAGWGPMLSRDNLTIPKDQKMFAVLSVIIPENAASGAEDNIIVTVTSQTDSTVSAENSCIALVTEVVRRVEIKIDQTIQSGAPGDDINYSVTVTNAGTRTDTFSLQATDNAGWSPSISPSTLTLAAGASDTATLTVTISDNAAEGDSTTIIVTASGTGYENSASCIAARAVIRGVEISISPESQTGSPKENVTFTVMVTNTGEVEDSYDLAVSDNAGWGAVLSDNLLTVPADENRTTTVSVIVPSEAIEGESTMITVTATSRGDPTVSDTAKCTANAREKPGPPPIVPIGVGGAAIGGGIALTLLLKKGMISVPFLRSRRRSMFSSMDLGQSRPSKRSLLNPRPVRSNPARARRFSKKWL